MWKDLLSAVFMTMEGSDRGAAFLSKHKIEERFFKECYHSRSFVINLTLSCFFTLVVAVVSLGELSCGAS